MVRRTVVQPEALSDADEARDWYASRIPALGKAFVNAFEAAVDRAEASPFSYAIVYRDLRRVLFRGFPYSIIYRVTDSELLVVSVMHQRRAPRRWVGRR